MKHMTLHRRPTTKILLVIGLALGLVFVLGAGMEMSSRAMAAEAVPGPVLEEAVQPAGLPLESTRAVSSFNGTASVVGAYSFDYTWLNQSGTAHKFPLYDYSTPFTATVIMTPTTTGILTVTGSIPVYGDIPFTVIGGTPTNPTVPVTGTATFAGSTTIEKAGRVTVTVTGSAVVTGVVTVSHLDGGNVGFVGSGPVTGSGPAQGSLTPITEHTIFLPIVYSTAKASTFNFYDNFSSQSTGNWWAATPEVCTREYDDGVLRVTANQKNEQCLIISTKVPPALDGKFSIRVRRITDEDLSLMYTFFFGQTGADLYENSYRLEVWPDRDPNLYLGAYVDDDNKKIKEKDSDDVNRKEDSWNDIEIVRDGSDIEVYINDELVIDEDDEYHRDKAGYFALGVVSFESDGDEVVVEWDDFRIEDGTTE